MLSKLERLDAKEQPPTGDDEGARHADDANAEDKDAAEGTSV